VNKATRVIILSALVIATPMLAYLGYQYFRPPADTVNINADIKETALNIGAAYLQDETGSDTKYLGKVVDISGKIAEIESNGSEGKTVYFESNDQSAPVAVLMTLGNSKNDGFSKGDSVLIRAFCTGYLMDVTFNRGALIKKY
jgi:tRNA_anti-like